MKSFSYNRRCVFEDTLARRVAPGGRVCGTMKYWGKRTVWSMTTSLARAAKRLLDIAVSLVALLVLAPLLVLAAVLIKLEDPDGSVFYIQDRVGQWGKVFRFPKFRSMLTRADQLKDSLLSENQHDESITFKMKNDPRITRTGRVIRRLSIDELPQLWCVLRGDMSLVGPRPALSREVALYTCADRRRLDAKPGLTCIWQVSGRGDIPFDGQVQLDEQYINSKNVWLDIKLLLKTIPAVLTGRGAY